MATCAHRWPLQRPRPRTACVAIDVRGRSGATAWPGRTMHRARQRAACDVGAREAAAAAMAKQTVLSRS
jgi:hypothetical protein